MSYKCPQCGYTSEQAGNCPTCNVPLVEAKPESGEQPSQPATPAPTGTGENQ